ncbi:MAG: cation:proton antiporter [Chlorobiaceae bacterium]|nr:cation:proton antiporter [Chlorobiaceae bacterium]
MTNPLFTELSLVIMVSAGLAWAALLLRQPIILAYILAGVLLGPSGLKLITSIEFIDHVSEIGITLLLFLAGVSLHPRQMLKLFGSSLLMTLGTGAIITVVAALALLASGLAPLEATVAGAAMMFSSTILVIKLMPTTTLHQQHMGALGIAILIIQDLIAVFLIALIKGTESMTVAGTLLGLLKGIGLVGAAFLAERYALRLVLAKITRYEELLNLAVLAWCFSVSIGAEMIGLNHETGAFIAGIALANNPLSRYLSENLKFFRDFFLVLFFFTLGAGLDFSIMRELALPVLLISALMLVIKPLLYSKALMMAGETEKFSRNLGLRLGQNSEFSFIIAIIAAESGILSTNASQLVQLTGILTMAASSYLQVSRLPSPLGLTKELKVN